jgi:hypothetical protein
MFQLSAQVLTRTGVGVLAAMAAAASFAAEPAGTQDKLEPLLAQALSERTHIDSRQLQPRPLTDASLLPASRVAVLVAQVQPLAIAAPGAHLSEAKQLQGRPVCVAEAGGYAGLLQARFGAQEVVFPSLAQALAGLRAGACDALVHDGSVLQALTALPDWKIFNASFPVGQARQLAVVLPSDSSQLPTLRQSANELQASAYPARLAQQLAQRLSDEALRGQGSSAGR